MQGTRVQSLVGELRSHIPSKATQKKKKKDLTECRRMLVCADNLSLQNRQKKKEEVRMEAVLEIEGRELEGLSLPCEARNWIIRG